MSSTSPLLRVRSVEAVERPFRLRMPFRFGLYTLTQASQALVRVTIELDGGAVATGHAAEVLLPKWFDKRPELSPADNEEQLRHSLRQAAGAYRAAGAPLTAFALFANHYAALQQAGEHDDLPPLVSGFGQALLDRAVLDALCRHTGCSFWSALQRNLPGLAAHAIAPDLRAVDFDAFLASLRPLAQLHARHTVGMLDELDGAASHPVDDGLPVTLADVIHRYGNTHFKLKLSGERGWDLERLGGIARVLDRSDAPYRVTIDGNEQFADVEQLLDLWGAIEARPELARLAASTLMIEQPVGRAIALDRPMQRMSQHCPVIIDESDGTLDAFVRARRHGYRGVSTKACKGLYKSLINTARCRVWNAEDGADHYFMSAEDLITQAGLSVQQDLALASLLGIGHIERNGHHYVNGFATCGAVEARAFAAAHPDLYDSGNDSGPRLRITAGRLGVQSSGSAIGFGTALTPITAADAPMAGLARVS